MRNMPAVFTKTFIDYCLDAEGIGLDDVDLVVRNCYILPVPEMEERLMYQDLPGFLPEYERADAKAHPWFRSEFRQGGDDHRITLRMPTAPLPSPLTRKGRS